MLSLTAPDSGRSSGYSLKSEETLTVTFSTKAFAGADITITSVELLAADFGGVNLPYGDLVTSNGPVSTTVHVQELSAPSGGGGGQGSNPGVGGGGGGSVPPVSQELPVVADEVVVEVEDINYFTYGAFFYCRVVFKAPVTESVNRIQWSFGNNHLFIDTSAVGVGFNTDRTRVGFPLFGLPQALRGKDLSGLREFFSTPRAEVKLWWLHR